MNFSFTTIKYGHFLISPTLAGVMLIGGERHFLGGTLTSVRVLKDAANVLRLLEEMR